MILRLTNSIILILQTNFEADGNLNKKPSKRPAVEEYHESLGIKLKVPAKKQKTAKKGYTTSTRAEAHTGAKQKAPVKKTPSKKLAPKRRVLAFQTFEEAS